MLQLCQQIVCILICTGMRLLLIQLALSVTNKIILLMQ